MKAELFKTDRNVKILIVSNESDYKSIFCRNSELFKSDIEFVADFECKKRNKKTGVKNEIEDLLELLKPDVLISENDAIEQESLKVLLGKAFSNEELGVQFINNNGNLLLWYQDIDIEKLLKAYRTLSLLINHSYEIKNKLGVE